MNDPNPYSPPSHIGPVASSTSDLNLDERDFGKMKAIVNDANQFWLAILLCFLCFFFGSLLMPVWYSWRLYQWSALANKYPVLLASHDTSPWPAKFRAAKWKMIVGMVAGCVISVGMFIWIMFDPFLFPRAGRG